MATCVVCKTQETQLYENSVPICIGCVKRQETKQDEIKRKHIHAIDSYDGNDEPNLRIVARYPK